MNLHPVILQALAPIMPPERGTWKRPTIGGTPLPAPSVDDEIEAEPAELEDQDDTCPACNGSGEGQYDGTTCPSCRGRGVAR